MAGVPLTLSQTKPDFEALVLQLQLFLNNRATWSDLLTSSTGETLVEMMAAVGTFNQFAIDMATREGFLGSAIRASSIYAIVRMLGVRISRKTPASVDVTISRTGDLTYAYIISPMTQFTIDGRPFFNRDSIAFTPGEADAAGARLYEGQIRQQTVAADSSTFREIYLNEPGFGVSDQDVVVTLTNPATSVSEPWSPIIEGIWTADATDKVYYDSTSGLGDVVLAFGDGHSGFLPALGNNINIVYAVTSGSAGNVGGSSLDIALATNALIKGKTNSQILGGADEKTPDYYKTTAPYIYKARNRAVTPVDYKAIASSYPGVASVSIQAQKDIAPDDLRWMNLVRICILPQNSDAFTDAEWDDFEAWFMNKSHALVDIQRFNPTRVVKDVEIVLYLKSSAQPREVVPQIEAAIRSLFAKDRESLGRRIAVFDISNACKISEIDYINIITPGDDLTLIDVNGKPDKLSFFALGTLSVTAHYSERA